MVETPHIVKEFTIGNTKIRIADNYCQISPEETRAILDRIAVKAQRYISAAASTGLYET